VKETIPDYCEPLDNGKPIPILKMDSIYYKYKSQKSWALENINLEVEEGETILVVGEIGSGKTTLIKLMLRLLKPSKGSIYLNGRCYKEFTVKSLYKKIGFMPQNCILFNRSILDNIRYDNESVTKKQVIDLLHKFGIMKHFENLEKGIDSMAGKNGMNLSGGQRQLVWFIKLYLKNPDVIIMDEPTASIDHQTKDLFKTIINDFMREKTVIIVTHDTELNDIADRTLRVKNKSIEESI
jgi:ABC-type bacteriocin/lantibiotic exporter with double-glycine peptidase domain